MNAGKVTPCDTENAETVFILTCLIFPPKGEMKHQTCLLPFITGKPHLYTCIPINCSAMWIPMLLSLGINSEHILLFWHVTDTHKE